MSSQEGCLHDCEGFFVNQRVGLVGGGWIYDLELTNISILLCLTQTKDKLILTSPGKDEGITFRFPLIKCHPSWEIVCALVLSFEENKMKISETSETYGNALPWNLSDCRLKFLLFHYPHYTLLPEIIPQNMTHLTMQWS